MKKIITIVLAVLLVFSLSVSSFAATLNDLLTSGRFGDPMYIRPDIAAYVKTGSGDYSGSASVIVADVSSNPVTFDFKSVLGMDDVLGVVFRDGGLINLDQELKAEINSDDIRIRGTFTVSIKYPSTIVVGASELVTGTMHGFTKNAANANMAIYNDTNRELVENADGTKTVKITVKLVNPDDSTLDYVTGAQLVANPAYLGDIEYTYSTDIAAYGSYAVTSTMRGETEIVRYDGTTENHIVSAKYVPEEPKSATATAIISQPPASRPSRPSTGTVVTPVDDLELTVVVKDGETFTVKADKNGEVDLAEVEMPAKEGYAVSDFYSDAAYQNKVEGVVDVNEIDTVYVRYINVGAPDVLNDDDHFAYIIGYPDGTVRPTDNITRDEVSTIIYRLMDEAERAKIETEENDFADVDETVWSNKYVSTMANGGYVIGYQDGTFRPENAITRAEFATIVARLYSEQLPDVAESKCNYTDIKGHWAEDYIKAIYELEIVNGYEDGTFKPDRYITRAEVMAIVNRVLVRYADAEGIVDGVREWSDVDVVDWYYYDVVEATNTHTFERRANGYNEDHKSYGENEWISTGVYEE